MELSVSQARPALGRLVTRAQDPRETIVLTRHGRPLAALVSMEEAQRIWRLQEDEWAGRRSVVSGNRLGQSLRLGWGMVLGPEGKVITHTEAAEIVHDRQMTRAEERRVLVAGGLRPVEGGELVGLVREQPPEPWWPAWWRRFGRFTAVLRG